MNYESRMDSFAFERSADIAQQRTQPECAILDELVRVLVQHPGGLRRWSVMRTIRIERERKSRDIPQKFEDEIERAFRRACATTDNPQAAPADALFFKPREKAGEVWAVFPDRAKAWLETGVSQRN